MGKTKTDFIPTWIDIEVQSLQNTASPEDRTGNTQPTEIRSILTVSNPKVPITNGIYYQPHFISAEEEILLVQDILERDFVWEGFDQRRRVQRYSLGSLDSCHDNELNNGREHYKTSRSIPNRLLVLHQRVEQLTGHKAQHVSVEEYSADKMHRSGEFASNNTVTTFESLSSWSIDDLSIFVAQVTLRSDSYQHCNRPKERNPNCWTLESDNHWTDILLQQRSVLIKTGDFLRNWRCRVSAAISDQKINKNEEDISSPTLSTLETENALSGTTLIVKFYTLPNNASEDNKKRIDIDDNDNYGYKPSENDRIPSPECPMPRLNELLTLIITTSPIKSNPSTEVIERSMESLKKGGPAFAFECRKIIVCDGCRLKHEEDNPDENGHRKVSVKYTNVKQSLRNGIVNTEQAENYSMYKHNLKQLCANAKNDHNSPFQNTEIVELDERHGYGFALRHVLREYVKTQFVCVVQHDRTLMRPTPINETVHSMWRHPFIKYVGMSMRSNLLYRDIFAGKYGRSYLNDFDSSVLRLPELVVKNTDYGPNSVSVNSVDCDSSTVFGSIQSLIETYRASAQGEIPQTACTNSGPCNQVIVSSSALTEGMHQIILVPTLFWYDNVHICDTSHYRDFIFHQKYKMVARGGFVEDKVSPVLKRTVERLGFKDGHSRFGCYLLDDASGMFFTGHLDGGSYLTSKAKEELRIMKTAESL